MKMRVLLKVIIVYESKYGNTKHVAEKIIEGIIKIEGISADLNELKEVDLEKIPEFDMILIGSPNHIGGPTRNIKKFIENLGKLNLKGKSIAVFDTYMGKDFEKAVKKMETRIREKTPDLKLATLGLSVRVQGMKGPVSEEDLPKCIEFGSNIVNQIKA
jgi:flavodoxin